MIGDIFFLPSTVTQFFFLDKTLGLIIVKNEITNIIYATLLDTFARTQKGRLTGDIVVYSHLTGGSRRARSRLVRGAQ